MKLEMRNLLELLAQGELQQLEVAKVEFGNKMKEMYRAKCEQYRASCRGSRRGGGNCGNRKSCNKTKTKDSKAGTRFDGAIHSTTDQSVQYSKASPLHTSSAKAMM